MEQVLNNSKANANLDYMRELQTESEEKRASHRLTHSIESSDKNLSLEQAQRIMY